MTILKNLNLVFINQWQIKGAKKSRFASVTVLEVRILTNSYFDTTIHFSLNSFTIYDLQQMYSSPAPSSPSQMEEPIHQTRACTIYLLLKCSSGSRTGTAQNPPIISYQISSLRKTHKLLEKTRSRPQATAAYGCVHLRSEIGNSNMHI